MLNIRLPLTKKEISISRYDICLLISILSFLMAIAFLSNRNIYDDEITSLNIITNSFSGILHACDTGDVHPPGMYVLAKSLYIAIGSYRWITIFPIMLLYLSVLCFSCVYSDDFIDFKCLVIFLFVCNIHPHLMMWGNSIRWYPIWTSLALFIFVCGRKLYAFEYRYSSWLMCFLICVLLVIMFHINYITILFIPAFFIFLWMMHGRKPYLQYMILLILLFFSVASFHQAKIFWNVHRLSSGSQESPLIVSFLRLFHGISSGEAFLPWHPVALVAEVFFVVLVCLLLLHSVKHISQEKLSDILFNGNPVWFSVFAFFIVFFAAGVVTGLSGKPRNFLILIPVYAYLVGIGMQWMNSIYIKRTAMIFIMIWIAIGYYHLLSKNGTAKALFNDKLDDVVEFVKEKSNNRRAIIFTSDPSLTYYLNNELSNTGSAVCSFRNDRVHGVMRGYIPDNINPELIFAIKSYAGSLSIKADKLDKIFNFILTNMDNPSEEKLSPDKDVFWKKKIPFLDKDPSVRLLPDYRFVVYYSTVSTRKPDLAKISELIKHF